MANHGLIVIIGDGLTHSAGTANTISRQGEPPTVSITTGHLKAPNVVYYYRATTILGCLGWHSALTRGFKDARVLERR